MEDFEKAPFRIAKSPSNEDLKPLKMVQALSETKKVARKSPHASQMTFYDGVRMSSGARIQEKRGHAVIVI
jgi:hypothetical protein